MKYKGEMHRSQNIKSARKTPKNKKISGKPANFIENINVSYIGVCILDINRIWIGLSEAISSFLVWCTCKYVDFFFLLNIFRFYGWVDWQNCSRTSIISEASSLGLNVFLVSIVAGKTSKTFSIVLWSGDGDCRLTILESKGIWARITGSWDKVFGDIKGEEQELLFPQCVSMIITWSFFIFFKSCLAENPVWISEEWLILKWNLEFPRLILRNAVPVLFMARSLVTSKHFSRMKRGKQEV